MVRRAAGGGPVECVRVEFLAIAAPYREQETSDDDDGPR